MTDLNLPGFVGENPLGFLSALGLLRVLNEDHPEWSPRLDWTQRGTWRPVLHLAADLDQPALARAVTHGLTSRVAVYKQMARRVEWNLKFSREKLRQQLTAFRDSPALAFLAAAAAELPVEKDLVAVSPLRMVNGSGHQDFLPIVSKIASSTTADHIAKTLFEPWQFNDDGRNRSLRWNPADRREYALRWDDPSTDEAQVQLGANRLAIEAVPLFLTFPGVDSAQTTGFHITRQGRRAVTWFRWPLWSLPAGQDAAAQSAGAKHGLGLDAVRSLLAHPFMASPARHRTELRQLGVAIVFESERLRDGYYGNFSPARAIPI